MRNIFLDTSVILSNPNIIQEINLPDYIYLTSTVLAELDHNKSKPDTSYAVREFTRLSINKDNIILVEDLPEESDNDFKIISTAKSTSIGLPGVVLWTRDSLMYFRAKALNLNVEIYGQVNIAQNSETFTGIVEGNPLNFNNLNPNTYVNDRQGYLQKWTGEEYVGLGKDFEVWGIKHKNLEQRCALDALMDDKISLVTLSGPAGTGKTIISLACAFEKVIKENKYNRIIVARPTIAMGNDIGFLPGTMEEKMLPWIQPVIDNMEVLFQDEESGAEKVFDEFKENGIIKVEPLTYIRGRSLPKQFMLIDEAQNLSVHELKTLVTRAGEGTKIVLLGDLDQIDNPKLNKNNSGFAYVIDKFKDQKIASHITLTKTERSKLAGIACKIL